MEQFLKRLSEIETTAQSIIDDADAKKKSLSLDMEKQCREFDAALEQEVEARIQAIRQNLEKEKDAQLTALRSRTEESFLRLDSYYEQNHVRLSKEIFHKIIQGKA